ncbi:DUF4136 domain-containing protein [Allomuricauda sp. SCSIO 65647]|uniref:DUF4136 domain-containing protein n=1 Tax=Allomuricauda sp. SCSIO 65647 TaxID=2908843 RepID=UPI001F3591AC|nr:DUF4136 domain-containing protein [Muricauda sp. SCSIO 65647]UJH66391.1 DUF4136 domain-containing protein [Muricauda sp. SCSIO 65647]
MKTTLRFLSVTLVLVFVSCSSLQVSSEAANNADLKKYNFYTLAETEEGFLPNVNPTQKMQLVKAIEEQARALSTVKNNSGITGPDVLINYFVVVDTKQDLDTYTNYYGRRRWRYQITEVEVREYTQGTLIVDFIDAKTKEVIWHGSTTGVITANSIKLEQKINDAVKAIFDKYKKDQLL